MKLAKQRLWFGIRFITRLYTYINVCDVCVYFALCFMLLNCERVIGLELVAEVSFRNVFYVNGAASE